MFEGMYDSFCGLNCSECEFKEHSFEKEHSDDNARVEYCKALKTEMVKKARQGINPIGFCGLHCDYCLLAQWCGGCRSGYNYCSFRTSFEDNICPNVKCAEENNLNGCYECKKLEECKIGYYGKNNEFIAKATTKKKKKYGEECFSKTLRKALDAGINYPKTFDKTGSIEGVIKTLEGYLN
jgi:hypothetical protein